jgi:hypothetical protein
LSLVARPASAEYAIRVRIGSPVFGPRKVVMRRTRATANQARLADTPSVPPSGIRARPNLPGDLIDAVASALEREALESDVDVRAELLARVRQVLDTWLRGALTTEEAIDVLAAAAEAVSGIGAVLGADVPRGRL